MTRLDALRAGVSGCTLCKERLPHGVRPVIQVHEEARILVAGQAPGRRVHASGIPFDDPSGERLRAWMDVSRETFYDARRVAILPMSFCYPGTGTSGDLPPMSDCAAAWRADLLAAMPHLELTLVVGRFAQAYHLPDVHANLTDCVRDWQTHLPNMIPLPHPSPRNNRWLSRNPWFERDLIPALRSRVSDVLTPYDGRMPVPPTADRSFHGSHADH